MMDVEVDVQDPQAVAARPRDRQGGVVVDAEPRGMIGHRVMEATTRVVRVLGVATEHGLHGPQGPSGHGGGSLVHLRERRVVAVVADPGLREAVRVGREPLHHVEVMAAVTQPQVRVRGGFRGKARLSPDRPEQLDPRPEPAWGQRVSGAEVVVGGPRSEDEEHGGHDTAARVPSVACRSTCCSSSSSSWSSS